MTRTYTWSNSLAKSSLGLIITVFLCYWISEQILNAQVDRVPPGSLILAGPKSANRETGGLTPEQKAMIRKTSQAWKNEVAKAQSGYVAAVSKLPHCSILDMSQITSKNDLLLREAVVKDCLEAAERFQDYTAHEREHYEEQVNANVPDEYIQKILIEGFPETYGKIQADALLVRNAEVKRIQTYVKALKVLEDNWGQWKWENNGSSSYIAANPTLSSQIKDFAQNANTFFREAQKAQEAALLDIKEMDASFSTVRK